MAPKITSSERVLENSKQFGTTTPKEFDVSKINIGDIMLKQTDDSAVRQWLNQRDKHNQPIYTQLNESKGVLKDTQKEIYELKRAMRKADSVEEEQTLQAQLKACKGFEWDLIRKRMRLAFSLM